MASSWIKIEVITPDKPEIYQLAELLSIDPDAVVGKLIRLWAWADQQTTDGNAECNAVSVTKIAIDRIAFAPGFAEALLQVGWLSNEDGALVFPNFERHNGNSSKKRGLTSKRVESYRDRKRKGNDARNAPSVTGAHQSELPEEEREEDKELKDPPIPPKGKKAAKPKFDPLAVEIPDWLPRPLWEDWVNYRKDSKRPIKTQQTVTETFAKLTLFRVNGHNPDAVIRESISNGWQGLFEPKNSKVRHGQNTSGNGESLAERQLREGREQWLRERGGHSSVEVMGRDDPALQHAVDYEEWEPSE